MSNTQFSYPVLRVRKPKSLLDPEVAVAEGMFLFAEMGCSECHSPPLFESETFANRNVPQELGIL